VPLAWEGAAGLRGTSGLVTPALLGAALDAGVRHFEAETYTLSVMPGAREDETRQDAILADELLHCLELFARD
jgi:hypothetical protein